MVHATSGQTTLIRPCRQLYLKVTSEYPPDPKRSYIYKRLYYCIHTAKDYSNRSLADPVTRSQNGLRNETKQGRGFVA